MITATVVIIV